MFRDFCDKEKTLTLNYFLSYKLNNTMESRALYVEKNSNFKVLTAYTLGDRVALFVSARGSSVRKFALVNREGRLGLHEFSRKTFRGSTAKVKAFFLY